MGNTLSFTKTVPAAPAAVYRAFTNASALQEWCCDAARVFAAVGDPLLLRWNSGYHVLGAYTALEENRKIAFTWMGKDEPGVMQVEVLLDAEGAGTQGDSTRVTLTHSGLGEGEAWARTREQVQQGWQDALETLRMLLETGADWRVQRRPMLGFYPGNFDANVAKKLGVPVEQGIYLGGVLDGMGAQKAGLQKDDVIVSMDGKPTPTFTEFTAVIAAHKGGDVIPVEFYRGAEKHSVQMTLSQRPDPTVPDSAAAFAEQAAAEYARLRTEMQAVVAGVPQDVLAKRPSAEEWSVNENMAHLIWCERWQQFFIWGACGGDDQIAFPGNDLMQTGGLVAVFPSYQALREELTRAEDLTVALLRLLPEALWQERRGTLVRLTLYMQGYQQHQVTHMTQMREALALLAQPA